MHYLNPDKQAARVLFFYRSFRAAENPKCHVGLGVGALHSVRILRRHKIQSDAFGVWTVEDVRARLREHPTTTHCVIEAPWISADETQKLMNDFPRIHFLVRLHSQVGFLQVEAGAITILRELLLLQDGAVNLTVAANNRRLKSWVERAYDGACLYLPNLYDLERVQRKKDKTHDHRLLRIASFGALRLLKNHTTAAAAAMIVARQRGSDLEFWVNVNREEHGKGVLDALRAMFKGLCWAKLVEHPWEDWAKFRRTVAHIDLGMQISMTETFNITTADAVAEGVPCVTTPAIEWVPAYWQVESDRVEDVARVAGHLLSSTDGAAEGLCALERYCEHAIDRWLRYLDGNPADALACSA